MQKKDQIQILKDLFLEIEDTIIKKGDDYATNDRLIVFKNISRSLNIPIRMVVLMFIETKIQRIVSLSSKESVNFEPLQDSVKDLICYSILLHMVDKD